MTALSIFKNVQICLDSLLSKVQNSTASLPNNYCCNNASLITEVNCIHFCCSLDRLLLSWL